jgi:AcrR family transcriptional regulator
VSAAQRGGDKDPPAKSGGAPKPGGDTDRTPRSGGPRKPGGDVPNPDDDAKLSYRRERVAQVQRARIFAALYELSAERGAGSLTVGGVVARAGVSRRTFYEQFASIEDCQLAALQHALDRVSARVLAAYDPGAAWCVRIRAALSALLAFCDEQPLLAQLLLVDSPGIGPRAIDLRERALAPVIAAIAAGEHEPRRTTASPPPLSAQGVVGGALSILHARLLASASSPGSSPRLLDLLGELMGVIVLPYLGPAAAGAELNVPTPDPPTGPPSLADAPLAADPLAGLDMRLTYRTMRVLAAIAAHPGCSNREAGQAAGVADQGQMSKLLRRLERLGLIVNAAADAPAGAANAWRTTARADHLCDTFAGSADGPH